MSIILVTGSAGLIGSESVKFFHSKDYKIIGIDNDMRAYFFGKEASTFWNNEKLQQELDNYKHFNIDIRDYTELEKIYQAYNKDIAGIIHTAAQPSHDWAAREPITDFTVNANGTLNLLELTRKYCPDAVFIFTSTNKVYGDTPNHLPLIELETRWEVDPHHPFAKDGIDESMNIDNSKHSLFGVSKVAADVLVQEYGKYFGMKTVAFRGGCLTGPSHSGAELHGFLAYLILNAVKNKEYTVFGYKGKQVRDNIHSKDLINAFWHYFQNPKSGEVYNIGGSRYSNISILEAINFIEDIAGYKLKHKISEQARVGDHIWYINNVNKFKKHYPAWEYEYDIKKILTEMINAAEHKIFAK
ncbi:MAG: NAD-dependent epimerase [Candidatus Melainabacteria bacterium RIFOXYA2_FULL_32_9]|nr:MAG: NAD-dependent epimerase [Candidatus Melainabacteria bacterium RIFOXYA2_FULL_32_9]